MKRQIVTTLASLSLFVMLAAVSVHAQSGSSLVVRIPFEFGIRGMILPAGEYTVTELMPYCLRVRSVDGRMSQVFLTGPTHDGTIPAQSMLVFNRYGDQYFLSKILTSGTDAGHQLTRSRAEWEIVRARTRLGKRAPESKIVPIMAHP